MKYIKKYEKFGKLEPKESLQEFTKIIVKMAQDRNKLRSINNDVVQNMWNTIHEYIDDNEITNIVNLSIDVHYEYEGDQTLITIKEIEKKNDGEYYIISDDNEDDILLDDIINDQNVDEYNASYEILDGLLSTTKEKVKEEFLYEIGNKFGL